MGMGADRAEAQPQDGIEFAEQQGWEIVPENVSYQQPESYAEEEAPRERAPARTALAVLLVLVALGWLAASGVAIYRAQAEINLAAVMSWTATISVPLILLGLLWQLFGRSSRRETERFTRAVVSMRSESIALESVLTIVATRLEENQNRLSNEAARLMALGDEASDRLGRVTHYLSRQSADLDRNAQALEAAAANARVDIGVLLHDLPRAEEQARLVADAMKEAGLTAHQQAGALEGQLSAVAARGREADEVVGSATQRLGAHLARIESNAGSASDRIEQAAVGMNAAVDGALGRASEAVEAARQGLETQAGAMLAMIEQSRAAFEETGAETSQRVAERLELIQRQLAEVSAELSTQDQASHALVQGLDGEVAALSQRFAQLGESGSYNANRLREAMGAVRESLQALHGEVQASHQDAGGLVERAAHLGDSFAQVTAQLRDVLPAALASVEEQSHRTGEVARAMVPDVELVEARSGQAAASLAEAEDSIARQREAMAVLLESVAQGIGQAEERLHALGEAVGAADGAAVRMVSETGPELIEALVRVREAATQAAERAREAIAAVIPQSVAALAEASRDALSDAVTEPVQEQLARLGAASEGSIAAARRASERLTRQLLTIGETAAAIEARIEEARAEREEKEAEGFSRRVALLIESLNSTAIDVTKILSNEVTDSAWVAYLKGDRGVFTRRAVRLLDSGEARAILRHYEDEPEFRDQVNRYIHDFEAMLRRVLADRDGSPLSITLLSSDMGKLYVALAQAIERLRS